MYLKYREKFNLSWTDFFMQPIDLIKKDFEIWSIEKKAQEWKQKDTKS